MKTPQILLFLIPLMLSGITFKTFSQAKKNENIVINAKGGIFSHDGTQLGYIDKDDIVKNNKGQKIYFIDPNGNVIDAYGKNLGKAKKNGSYYNIKGENIILVKDLDQEKCAILDPKGHSMGTVHKNYKLHACAAHCFFLAKEKEKAN